MKVLLDTNAYSGLMRGASGVLDAIRSSEQVVLSWTVVGELLFGFRLGNRVADNVRRLHEFLGQDVVSLVGQDYEVCESYATIGEFLRREGRPIPTNDHWIAATAIRHGLTLLSRDQHFSMIPHLQWKDWSDAETTRH